MRAEGTFPGDRSDTRRAPSLACCQALGRQRILHARPVATMRAHSATKAKSGEHRLSHLASLGPALIAELGVRREGGSANAHISRSGLLAGGGGGNLRRVALVLLDHGSFLVGLRPLLLAVEDHKGPCWRRPSS